MRRPAGLPGRAASSGACVRGVGGIVIAALASATRGRIAVSTHERVARTVGDDGRQQDEEDEDDNLPQKFHDGYSFRLKTPRTPDGSLNRASKDRCALGCRAGVRRDAGSAARAESQAGCLPRLTLQVSALITLPVGASLSAPARLPTRCGAIVKTTDRKDDMTRANAPVSPARRTLLAGLLAVPACAPLPATSPLSRDERRSLRIERIEVEANAANLLSEAAEERRNLLPGDLTEALRGDFADRIGSGGATLIAEIQRFNVVGGTATAFGRDRSELSGVLRLVDTGGRVRASVPITVTAGVAGESFAGSAARAAVNSREGYYRDLLDRFAADARVLLLGRDRPGERLVRSVTAG